ncbi:RNA methyltransferase, putative [Plasmodium ovale curtisi]|uniref:RNA methyltransferase, putative n=1 Tax=Plasmodium ovale curtisi TaxID=864141 RepID=A0A1A8VY07_PLAOA|nr:RNA methyltransferase, putative [Plasmodium ovale curtisi]
MVHLINDISSCTSENKNVSFGKRGGSSAATYSDSGNSGVSGDSDDSGISGSRGEDLFIPHWMNLDEGGGRVKSNQWEEERTSNCRQKSSDANVEQFLPISKRSKMMKYVIRLRKKSNYRKKKNSFFVKGSKTILELSKNNDLLFEAILSNSKNILYHFQNRCKKLYYINNDILNYIFHDSLKVKKETNCDSIAVLKIPSIPKKVEHIKFLLALDKIRYAYNLGNILNVAYSMNIDCIFYIYNTVDPFNHKVIEITKGSHFKIPHIVGSYTQLKDFCNEQNLLPIVAHTNGTNPHNVLKNSIQKGICLILGNESTGPHDDVLTFAKPITLPMHEMTNSLNVFCEPHFLFVHFVLKNIVNEASIFNNPIRTTSILNVAHVIKYIYFAPSPYEHKVCDSNCGHIEGASTTLPKNIYEYVIDSWGRITSKRNSWSHRVSAKAASAQSQSHLQARGNPYKGKPPQSSNRIDKKRK